MFTNASRLVGILLSGDWRQRSEYLLAVNVSDEDYNSVPLQTTFTARANYRHVGPLKPPPYPFDE